MANPLLDITKVASGAVTKDAVVVLDSVAKVLLPGGANVAKFGGVAGHVAAIGEAVRLRIAGVVDVVAGAAVVPGDWLVIAGTTGKVTPAGTTAGTVYNIIGVALEAAAADGDIIEMLIAPCTRNAAVS